jgi:hypothetical protein
LDCNEFTKFSPMTATLSLDQAVVREAEQAAGEFHMPVATLYALAVREFVATHRPATASSITERLNQYYGAHPAVLDEDIAQTQYDLLGEGDW